MRIRWSTGGRGGRLKFGTRPWWILFACGFLAILAIKTADRAHLRQQENQREPAAWTVETESAPVVPEKDDGPATNGKPASGPAASDKSGGMIGNSPLRKLSDYDRLFVSVYLTKEKRIEKLPIELYVRGVIAGEMPVDFQLEALKAQAIAARTYIYRRLADDDRSGMPEGSGDAEVTDTTRHQVYIPLAELLGRWQGETKLANLEKLNRAVKETKGLIVTYHGQPIQAAFFSTSNGYTENASDYWNVDLPYLRSVASPWDVSLSPSYKTTTELGIGDFSARLGVSEQDSRGMRVLETTAGKRIKSVEIGGKTLSGREVREKLGLSSSEFDWKIDGDTVRITCYGSGHGVGMSQWGADGMALDGMKAPQILAHYYSGTELEQVSKLPFAGLS
ncbi:stage II sporulation protein D [Paenibacillus humicola]|uniref:stage II sporulation protein D n=1 Tax=Paenibacillus humicola TaxID=3110540 RepID=UPI00237AB9DB|nr:stage II sporulation protein D [Paenibacillus humicola]